LAALTTAQVTGLVAVVLQNEVDMAILPQGFSDCLGQFRQDVQLGIVSDRVNRIQTQSIKVILVQPVQRIVDEKVPGDPALGGIEVNAISPGRAMAIRKKVRRVGTQVVSFGAKVVVDDIQ